MHAHPRRGARAVLALVALLPACRTLGPHHLATSQLTGTLITARAIAQSHARNAWEVLEHNSYFRVEESPNGEPTRLESRRGRSSIILSSSATPLVYMDGTQLLDLRLLREITAESILSIRILDGIEGTTFYGTNAGAGVIVIKTKAGPEPL